MSKISKFEAEKHIRPLDLTKDLEDVANIIETCFDTYLDDDGHRFLRHLRSLSTNRSLQNRAQLFLRLPMQGFVWEEDGKIIGNLSLMFVRATIREQFISIPKPGYLIANVATYPEHEGRGIAKALTDRALAYIKSRNLQHAFLQVRDNNPTALHIYESYGFREFARRSTWFKMPERNSVEINKDYLIKIPNWKDWIKLRTLYTKNYPKNVQWHLPIQIPLLRPGTLGSLNRSIYEAEFKQWALYNNQNHEGAIGSVTWQTSKNMTNYIWVASDEHNDMIALSNLIPFMENQISRKKVTLDFPYSRGNKILSDLGFIHKQNLIWMDWHGTI